MTKWVWMASLLKYPPGVYSHEFFLNIWYFFISASRESGFINAITSAGVSYFVTEACAEGRSIHCRCDNTIRGGGGGMNWAGCNRPIAYGIWFSSLFIDAVEALTRKKRHPRKQMNLHNNRAGREVAFFCFDWYFEKNSYFQSL